MDGKVVLKIPIQQIMWSWVKEKRPDLIGRKATIRPIMEERHEGRIFVNTELTLIGVEVEYLDDGNT